LLPPRNLFGYLLDFQFLGSSLRLRYYLALFIPYFSWSDFFLFPPDVLKGCFGSLVLRVLFGAQVPVAVRVSPFFSSPTPLFGVFDFFPACFMFALSLFYFGAPPNFFVHPPLSSFKKKLFQPFQVSFGPIRLFFFHNNRFFFFFSLCNCPPRSSVSSSQYLL